MRESESAWLAHQKAFSFMHSGSHRGRESHVTPVIDNCGKQGGILFILPQKYLQLIHVYFFLYFGFNIGM